MSCGALTRRRYKGGLNICDQGDLSDATKAKEAAAIKQGVERGNQSPALIACFINLSQFYRHCFENKAAGPPDFIELFGDLVPQIIEDDGLRRVVRKTGIGAARQVPAFAVANPDLNGQGIVHALLIDCFERLTNTYFR
jgi:hypothetical protein